VYEVEAVGEINKLVYSLEYIDSDDIPELVYGSTSAIHASNIYILKYVDGKVLQLGPIGAYNMFSFYENCNIMPIDNNGMNVGYTSYYTITESGELINALTSETVYEEESSYEEVSTENYYLLGEEVSKEEFDSYTKSIPSEDLLIHWSCYDNEKNYTEINTESIAQLRTLY